MMTPTPAPSHNADILLERVRYLEESNRRYVAILDMISSNGNFLADLGSAKSVDEIFRIAISQLKRILPFQNLGCYENLDDASFSLVANEPLPCGDELQSEIDHKILDGTFAWALNRNQAILVPTIYGNRTLLLHVIASQSRIRGMFAGILPEGQTVVDASSLNAVTIMLTTTAYALESSVLYNMLRENMANLEQKVQERTVEIRAARDAAECANRAKSEFLANMSHELRTPLNATIGFTDVVLSRICGELNETQEEYLGYVLQSSRHLLSLINDILDLSKIEADKMELSIGALNIAEIVNNSLIMVKEMALDQGVVLNTAVDANTPQEFPGDGRKILQILYNLLSNAVKFSPGGGVITLRVHCMRDNMLEFAVSDNGIGLESSDLERIFRPFEQVDGSESRSFQGTGLGLSLTRRLVELHGGTIWVESAGIGQGSTFYFTLPPQSMSDKDCRFGTDEHYSEALQA
jgi:signal transduction histidine kinase